jgi:hypothetical protein
MKTETVYYIYCSAKNCENIPEWEHKGLQIALCPICFNKIDFQNKFTRLDL